MESDDIILSKTNNVQKGSLAFGLDIAIHCYIK